MRSPRSASIRRRSSKRDIRFREPKKRSHTRGGAARSRCSSTLPGADSVIEDAPSRMRRNRRSSKPAKPAAVQPTADVEADFRSARTALNEGAFDGAIDGFRKMLEAVPNHANALSGLGNALAMSGRVIEALKVLRQARDAARMDPIVQYEVGHGFVELRRFDDAALAFQAAVIASPS